MCLHFLLLFGALLNLVSRKRKLVTFRNYKTVFTMQPTGLQQTCYNKFSELQWNTGNSVFKWTTAIMSCIKITAKFCHSDLQGTGHAELSNMPDYHMVPILT
jgi:hypothetical protein